MFRTTAKKFFSSWDSFMEPPQGPQNRQNPPKSTIFSIVAEDHIFRKFAICETRDLENCLTNSHQNSGACQACSERLPKSFFCDEMHY